MNPGYGNRPTNNYPGVNRPNNYGNNYGSNYRPGNNNYGNYGGRPFVTIPGPTGYPMNGYPINNGGYSGANPYGRPVYPNNGYGGVNPYPTNNGYPANGYGPNPYGRPGYPNNGFNGINPYPTNSGFGGANPYGGGFMGRKANAKNETSTVDPKDDLEQTIVTTLATTNSTNSTSSSTTTTTKKP